MESLKKLPVRALTSGSTRALLKVREKGGKKKETITFKKSRFVDYYLDCGSARKAALAAGYDQYTANSASYFLLKDPAIVQELSRRTKEYFKTQGVDPERILAEMWNIYNVNLLDLGEVNSETGEFKLDLRRINRAQAAGIVELSYDFQGRPKVKLADKRATLETMYKLMCQESGKASGERDEGPLTLQKIDSMVKSVTINHQHINIINEGKKKELPPIIDVTAASVLEGVPSQ